MLSDHQRSGLSRSGRVLLIVLCLGVALFAGYWAWWRPLPFDSEVWRSHAGFRSSERYRMRAGARQLITQGVIKSRADALRYFGPSGTIGRGSETSPLWHYELGPRLGDYYLLMIQFDESGLIIGHHIYDPYGPEEY
jgi:hypothetical protein